MEHRERKSDMMTCSCVRRPVRSISVAVSEHQHFVRKWSQMSIKFAIICEPPKSQANRGGCSWNPWDKVFIAKEFFVSRAIRRKQGCQDEADSGGGSSSKIEQKAPIIYVITAF